MCFVLIYLAKKITLSRNEGLAEEQESAGGLDCGRGPDVFASRPAILPTIYTYKYL